VAALTLRGGAGASSIEFEFLPCGGHQQREKFKIQCAIDFWQLIVRMISMRKLITSSVWFLVGSMEIVRKEKKNERKIRALC